MTSLIGNLPNQVPTNADLGTMAFQDAAAISIGSANVTGNVGIGTNTPAGKLEVKVGTNQNFNVTSTNSITQLQAINDAATVFVPFDIAGSVITLSPSSDSTKRLTLDASGNLGLGVTASAWGSAYKAIDVNTYGSYGAGTTFNYMSGNLYYNGTNWIYKTANTGLLYYQTGGQHQWFNAVTGIAGATATINQAMTLESGRLLIGATTSFSSAAKLQVQDNISLETNGTGGKLEFFKYGVSTGFFDTPATSGQLDLNATSILSFSTNNSERMRLDATGNVGIGTNTPASKLDVRTSLTATTGVQNIADFYATTSATADSTYGGRITLWTKNPNNNYWPAAIAAINDAGGSNLSSLAFYTATSGPTLNERMRIDSAGNVGVGTTAPATKLHITTTGNAGSGSTLTLDNTGGWATGIDFKVNYGGYMTSKIFFDFYGSEYATGSGSHGMNYVSGRTGTSNHWFRDSTGAVQVAIINSGNVGIGTLAPSNKLEVSSTTAGVGVTISKANSATVNENGGILNFYNYAPVNQARVAGTIIGQIYFGASQPTSAAIQDSAAIKAIAESQSGNNTQSALAFFTAGPSAANSERMRIDSAGNVGIGTTPKSWYSNTFMPAALAARAS